MNDRHPDPETLERFLDDDLPEEEVRSILRHLFVCAACEELVIESLPALPASALASAAPAADPERALSLDRVAAGLDEERRQGLELWRDLAPLAPAKRRALVENERRFATLGLVELLLEHCRRAVASDPTAALALAELALSTAERLCPERYPEPALAAARTRSLSHLGNARRIFGDYRAAERCFQEAEEWLEASWLDPLDDGQLLQFRASLWRDLGRIDEAIALLEQAIGIYRAINEPHQQGKALISRGILLYLRDDLPGAGESLRRGVFLIDRTEEPRLAVCAQQYLILGLQKAGRPQEALQLLETSRDLWTGGAEALDRIRLHWLEAQILISLDRLAEAEAILLEVRQGFIDANLPYDAALAALELATVYARRGRSAEIRRLADEMMPIFGLLDVKPALLAALIVFETAARQDRLSFKVLREISARIERARTEEWDPSGAASRLDPAAVPV